MENKKGGSYNMAKKKVNNNKWDIEKAPKGELKTYKIIFIILGLWFLFMGLFAVIFILPALFCFYFAYTFNRELKRRKTVIEPVREVVKEPVTTPVRNTVKVTDLDGSVRELGAYLVLDQNDVVLVAEGGKTYHKYLGCFKNWKPEMIDNFNGWKIIKKSEALANGMKYCSFCEEKDRYKDIELDDEWEE